MNDLPVAGQSRDDRAANLYSQASAKVPFEVFRFVLTFQTRSAIINHGNEVLPQGQP